MVHKRNIYKIRGAKYFKSTNGIKGNRKCMVVLKFLENIEGAIAFPLPPINYAYVVVPYANILIINSTLKIKYGKKKVLNELFSIS